MVFSKSFRVPSLKFSINPDITALTLFITSFVIPALKPFEISSVNLLTSIEGVDPVFFCTTVLWTILAFSTDEVFVLLPDDLFVSVEVEVEVEVEVDAGVDAAETAVAVVPVVL